MGRSPVVTDTDLEGYVTLARVGHMCAVVKAARAVEIASHVSERAITNAMVNLRSAIANLDALDALDAADHREQRDG